MKPALFYEPSGDSNDSNDSTVKCLLCPHGCVIKSGYAGYCGIRRAKYGRLWAESYGRITSIALDPIEKKPLKRFHPDSMILSLGSYGCNFSCPFCQNHEISMGKPDYREMPPEEVAALSLELANCGNIGAAYTYNEPLITYEFVRDCAALIRAQGQKNVLVTNGFINPEPLIELLPLIDAMNVDLKSFSSDFYSGIGGVLERVKDVIALAAKVCHVEVTTLVIPDENDSPEEISALAAWLSQLGTGIPLHLSRFFPRYKLLDKPPTPISTMRVLEKNAKKHLDYVYLGNC